MGLKTDKRLHHAKTLLRALATGSRVDLESSTKWLARFGVQIRQCHATGLVTSWSRAYTAKQQEAVELFDQIFDANDAGDWQQRSFLRRQLKRLGIEVDFDQKATAQDGESKPPAPKTFSRADRAMYDVIRRS